MALQSLESPQNPPLATLLSFWSSDRRLIGIGFAYFALAVFAGQLLVADVTWRTGTEFQQQLQSQLSMTWQSRGLREGLETLAQTQGVAIFLDRRVDPDRRISYACDGKPLETAIRGIAGKARLGVGFVGPVIYVGPPLTCARIATLTEVRNEQVKDLPSATHKRLLRKNDTAWPDLIEPRLLLTRVATRAGVTIPNVQSVPHDIWRSAKMPKLTFAEQATLILSGFDMSFRWHKNARQVFIVKFPEATSIERAYGSADPEALAAELRELLPQAFVEVKNKRVVVRSLLEDHWNIERTRGTKGTPEQGKTNPEDKRYTLTVKNQPAAKLFELLAKQLQMELVIREDTPSEKLEKPISFSVNEARSMEVFKAMARAASLDVQFDTGIVHVFDRKTE